tara:strand:+ start:178 stop:363 length:186 start_codon:yes stop_codon:yes gene_type:complete
MSELFSALALAIALEGIVYALFPDRMKRVMSTAIEQPTANLRFVGLLAAMLGVAVLWVIRG